MGLDRKAVLFVLVEFAATAAERGAALAAEVAPERVVSLDGGCGSSATLCIFRWFEVADFY